MLKPGGHLVAFGATRTHHRLSSGLEDAGLEVRDELSWLFGEGMPKALNVAKALDKAAGHDTSATDWAPVSEEAGAWVGWNTHLRPGHEPIVVARAPTADGSVARNVLAHGTRALHIDARRLKPVAGDELHDFNRSDHSAPYRPHDRGRWPANVILSAKAADELDEQSGLLRSGPNPTRRTSDKFVGVYGRMRGQSQCRAERGADAGGAARFYYTAKATHHERHAGCERWGGNPHPTPKPISLMRRLVRVVTPPGGVILDPFAGSGGTGIAVVLEGFDFIGIERENTDARPYVDVCGAWIAHWQARPTGPAYPPRRQPLPGQTTIDELLVAA